MPVAVSGSTSFPSEHHLVEQRLHALLDCTGDVLWISGPGGTYDVPNPRWERFTGLSFEQARGHGWLEAIHPGDRERTRQCWQAAVASRSAFSLEHRIRREDGVWRWMSSRAAPVYDGHGKLVEWVGLHLDVTARREADDVRRIEVERAARQWAELEATYAAAPVGLCVLDRELRFVRVNERFAEMNGAPGAAHMGRTVREVVPTLADEAEPLLRRVLETGEPLVDVEISGETPAQPGVTRYWREQYRPLRDAGGAIVGLNIVAEEITAAKLAEDERRFRSEQFRTLLERAPLGIYVVDADFRVSEVNPVAMRAFAGMPRGVLGRDFEEVCRIMWPPPLLDEVVRIFRHTLATGEPYHQADLAERRADRGVTEHYDWRVERLTLPDGRFGLVCYFQDISAQVRAREALAESEARFREMADHAPVMVWVTTADGHCTFLSRSWYDFTGQTEDSGLGFGWFEAVHPDDRAEAGRIFRAAAANARDFAIEYRLRSRDGEYRWMLDAATPRRGADGAFLGYIGSVLDITERRRTEERLRANRDTFLGMIANNPFGIYVIDADFRMLQVSRGAQKTFETVRPLLGRDLAEVLRILWPEPFASEAIARFRHTLATGESHAQPGTVEQRADIGVVEAYDWRIERVTLPDGRFGVVCYFYDLSAQRALEAALGRSEQALREADRSKDEFLATLAHELRNPLAPLRTAIHILRSPQAPEHHRSEARAMIERQIATMTRLVDDLLDVSRLTLGRIALRLEPVSLAVAIEQALETASAGIEAGRHRLIVDLPEGLPWVNGDVTRLAQVFTNLLTNAAKYTPPGGEIRLYARAEGPEVLVCVRDSGVGIPAGMLERVFELFTQIPRHGTMAQGGLGIGLALARRMIEMHGGKITVTSEGEGRGSEFCVRLPRHDAGAEPVPRDDGAVADSEGGCEVLVVDDNVDAAESLAMLLQLQGHAAHAVHSGDAALAAIADGAYQAVLLDIGLPDLSGYEVARRIRARLGDRCPRLIALTGWGQESDRERAREAGFDEHLTKPADPDALARLVAGAQGTPASH